jgi:hypothetical protein
MKTVVCIVRHCVLAIASALLLLLLAEQQTCANCCLNEMYTSLCSASVYVQAYRETARSYCAHHAVQCVYMPRKQTYTAASSYTTSAVLCRYLTDSSSSSDRVLQAVVL